MSAKGRSAPAFQEYASDMIARLDYRTLTLPQRGLLYSLRLELWVNQFLPESSEMIGRILGYDPAEVAAELPYVMPFLACENGRIFSPELEAYREHLNERHARQSDAAKLTNEKRWGSKPRASSEVQAGIAKRHAKRNGERVASGSLLSREEPSLPSQEGDVSTTSIKGGYQWPDFTQDPEGEQ